MTFRVGQKVVCVDDKFSPIWFRWETANRPVLNGIYTIRGIRNWRWADPFGTTLAIYLQEIINPVRDWTDGDRGECPFATFRFRPLIEKKTDISIFTAMLKTERQPILTEQ